MTEAFFSGALAASSLLLGALVAFWRPIEERTLGLVMAFGAGVLISAVTYDLVGDAFELSEGVRIPLGLFVGALVFYGGNLLINRAGGEERKSIKAASSEGNPTAKAASSEGSPTAKAASSEGNPTAIVLGAVLDGIPESLVLGLSLLAGEGLSVTLLAAIFLSNFPESMAATVGLMNQGRSKGRIFAMWSVVVLVCALSSAAGFALLDGASNNSIAFVEAFAAGAILTMLTDTMMPEAFEHGGALAGLSTTFGFTLAFLIASFE